MPEKKVLMRVDVALWSRCKALASRRGMGVWQYLGIVLGEVVRIEEGLPRKGVVPKGEVEESVEEAVRALFGTPLESSSLIPNAAPAESSSLAPHDAPP